MLAELGKVARSRKYRGDDEHQGDEDVELSRTPGAAAPDPAAYGLSPPLFQPSLPTRTRQDLSCTSAGNPAPL